MVDRREFLASLSLSALLPTAPTRFRRWAPLRFTSHPFPLGVASGDPASDGFVLWTRLARQPERGDGGMPLENVAVAWEVARDEGMKHVVRRGTELASPNLAHSVHVEVEGLEPDRWYWYRFVAAGESSPIGRARTMPRPDAQPAMFPFAFISCQHYEQGYYTAFQHLAQEDLHLIAHLGDYIYEGGRSENAIRPHPNRECLTLGQYRRRYALYKGDPDLQAAHAMAPWVVTWDDHEVDNNYAGAISENNDPPTEFRLRRANAYQAYYEHQPVRRTARPIGSRARLHRIIDVGSLARFHLLDTRQHRTDQPCGDRNKAPCAEMNRPNSTMIGARQEAWLRSTFGASNAKWNVIAQQVLLAKLDQRQGPGEVYSMDSWNGYPAARQRLLQLIAERGAGRTVVLTGDVHSSWASDLLQDFGSPTSPVIASELVGTSISSGGDGRDALPNAADILAENPHIKYHNERRGYVRCRVGADRWTADFRMVRQVTRRGSPVETHRSLHLEAGRPGIILD